MNKFNFSGGPGALPDEVLEEASQALLALPETGLSVLGMSHRSEWFYQICQEAQNNVRFLLNIPENYHILFLQGGGSLQFSMIPQNFLRESGLSADYIVSGYWSAKAPPEGMKEGHVSILWDGRKEHYRTLPSYDDLSYDPKAAYLHYVSNETVEGLSFTFCPGLQDVPRVCDMSSDILSKPIDIQNYALIYAHAQKNLGPAGVTLVIIQDEFLQKVRPNPFRHSMLDYRTQIEGESRYNTPPVFAIYVLMLVTRWLRKQVGSLEKMAEINGIKAQLIYTALSEYPDFYKIHAHPAYRSPMNIAFHLTHRDFSQAELSQAFLEKAIKNDFSGLEGHRSLGGQRISLYNAISIQAAEALAEWLKSFPYTL
jgi:phosphoserine aminotransferase